MHPYDSYTPYDGYSAIQTQRRRNVPLTSVRHASDALTANDQTEEKMQWDPRGRKRWRSCVPAVAAAGGDGGQWDSLHSCGSYKLTANAPFVCAWVH